MSPAGSDPDDVQAAFDKIVEGLDISLPDDIDEPAPRPQPDRSPIRPTPEVDFDDTPDPDPAYRQVPPARLMPRDGRITAAWVGLFGSPALLMLATMFGYFLPRPVTIAAIITFVASAIYLFSRLPAHERGRWDGPDDGAVL